MCSPVSSLGVYHRTCDLDIAVSTSLAKRRTPYGACCVRRDHLVACTRRRPFLPSLPRNSKWRSKRQPKAVFRQEQTRYLRQLQLPTHRPPITTHNTRLPTLHSRSRHPPRPVNGQLIPLVIYRPSQSTSALLAAAQQPRAFTTASSQKKRKLDPFNPASFDRHEAQHLQQQQHAHASSSRSSSSPPRPPPTNSSPNNSPSPASSHTTSTTTRNPSPPLPAPPLRYLPPHLHDEVAPWGVSGKEAVVGEVGVVAGAIEGQSPSSALAEFAIDSGSSVDMEGSENGAAVKQQRAVTSPGGGLGQRSASPAKRRAADMEDAGESDGIHAGRNAGTDTQDTMADSETTSTHPSMATTLSAASFDSDEAPPPYSVEDTPSSKGLVGSGDGTPSLDDQVQQVRHIATSQVLDEGLRGYVISTKWLARVLSRSAEGLHSTDYPKEAREGDIGPVDNSDIVPDGVFSCALLHDVNDRPFVPLRPGLNFDQDFQILPEKAWGLIVSWYGLARGQKQIERYAHNTAEFPAVNIMYEMYPPVITIRKVPHDGSEVARPVSTASSASDGLRRRQELREKYGQASSDDAIHLVSSRSERFQKFLERSKEAAGIARSTRVLLWRHLDLMSGTANGMIKTDTDMLSPPHSRSASQENIKAPTKLVVTQAELKDMEIGKHISHINVADETNNPKYNGSSTMDLYGLYENQTILLEEQMGGPGGGESCSDLKKTVRIILKNGVLKPKTASAPTSGRTSPAPGGMMTRGRTNRSGRTRGTLGLGNLGNTCYMNSALQCIRSVEELAIYFLSGTYKSEINASNPLGHGGTMAKQYANLLGALYAENASGHVTPSAFKRTLGNIQPLFSGYGQQDSQEFLSFLVDALHEDLNRIVRKPYNENPDSDDSTVNDPQAIIELGEIYRRNHKARNDSIAMDLFSGFYKNTMECPVCQKISITFDPYSLLTVQLPIENTFQHTITFVPLHGKPVNHDVDIDKNATIRMLKQSIADKYASVSADRLWMAEVYSHKIYKVFTDDQQSLGEAGFQTADHLFMFELADKPTNVPELTKKKVVFYTYSTYSNDHDIPTMDSEKADRMAVPVFMRRKGRYDGRWEIAMHPIYVLITREEAHDFDAILKKVLVAVSRQTSRPILTEFDEEKDGIVDGISAVNGEAEKADSSAEEAAQVSDRSVPSEDGYVEVSIGKPDADDALSADDKIADQEMAKGVDDTVPPRFMDPQYYLSPALRNQLFTLNYARSAEGLNCASMTSFDDKNVRDMFDRVKRPARRASVESISPSVTSTASTGSTTQLTVETEESDIDDDQPDLTIGNELLASATVQDSEEESETLPDNPLESTFSRGGRRARGKVDKFPNSSRKLKTYSKKERKRMNRERNLQNRPNSRGSVQSNKSQRSFDGSKLTPPPENPYYIQLGEGIVLNWSPEGWDALFGGDRNGDDNMRGHWLSTDTGRMLETFSDPALEAKKAKRAARKTHGITLEDCFVETGKREILSEDNAWYCNRCKEMRQAAKTLEIWTLPDVLIVHLKRFGGNRTFRDKIDVLVDYPVEGLDMTQKVGLKEEGKGYVYDLFAVDNHYGGLGGGHYTATAKNFYDGQWYDYNDSICSKASDAKLQSAAAYLLFYRRRSDTPLGPPRLQEIVTAARNPDLVDAAAVEEAADDSDSGEGRLGVPNGFPLHGSSSALAGAGATMQGNPASHARALAPARSGGVGLAGAVAGSSQTSIPMTRLDSGPDEEPYSPLGYVNGRRVCGPLRPPQYGDQGAASWGFDNLDAAPDQPIQTEDDEGSATLLHTMERVEDNDLDNDDDNVSTAAEADSALGDEYDDDEDGPPSFYDPSPGGYTPMQPSAGLGTPEEEYSDDHRFYSGAHETQDADVTALHLEDALAGEDDDAGTAAEIHLSDRDGEGDEDGMKMD